MSTGRSHKLSLDASPNPADIRAAREAAGLTQTAAAASTGRTLRAWQNWEAGERDMPASDWCLFLLLTGQASLAEVRDASKRARESA